MSEAKILKRYIRWEKKLHKRSHYNNSIKVIILLKLKLRLYWKYMLQNYKNYITSISRASTDVIHFSYSSLRPHFIDSSYLVRAASVRWQHAGRAVRGTHPENGGIYRDGAKALFRSRQIVGRLRVPKDEIRAIDSPSIRMRERSSVAVEQRAVTTEG